MIPITRRTRAILLLLVATACAGEPESPDQIDLASPPAELMGSLDQARSLSGGLVNELGGMVQRALAEEGPAGAIRVCSETAQERTRVLTPEGVYMRRVGTRTRNPANEPDREERLVLAKLLALQREGDLPDELAYVRQEPEGRSLHYVRPIVLGQPCLTCHGDPANIPGEVREVLDRRYPDDEAVGYSEGDLRGAVSVRVPLGAGT